MRFEKVGENKESLEVVSVEGGKYIEICIDDLEGDDDFYINVTPDCAREIAIALLKESSSGWTERI